MHVHIDRIARQIEKQEHRGPITRRDGGTVARFRGPHDEWIADRASPYEDVALAPGGLRLRRALREARHFERSLPMFYGEQRVGHLASPQRVHAIDGTRRRADIEQDAEASVAEAFARIAVEYFGEEIDK